MSKVRTDADNDDSAAAFICFLWLAGWILLMAGGSILWGMGGALAAGGAYLGATSLTLILTS